jgi:hypothetical protein
MSSATMKILGILEDGRMTADDANSLIIAVSKIKSSGASAESLNEAVTKILSMLDDGIVKPSDAVKLLDALSSSSQKESSQQFSMPSFPNFNTKIPRVIVEKIERIPEMINTKLGELNIETRLRGLTMQSKPQDIKMQIQELSKARISMKQGDLTIKGVSEGKAFVEGEHVISNISNTGSSLAIDVMGGDIKAGFPKGVKAVIQSFSGDIELMNVSGSYNIASYSGDVSGVFSGVINTGIYSGDADFTFPSEISGRIQCLVVIRMYKNCHNADLILRFDTGAIYLRFEKKNGIGDERLCNKYSCPEAEQRLKLENMSGDITITRLERLYKEL